MHCDQSCWYVTEWPKTLHLCYIVAVSKEQHLCWQEKIASRFFFFSTCLSMPFQNFPPSSLPSTHFSCCLCFFCCNVLTSEQVNKLTTEYTIRLAIGRSWSQRLKEQYQNKVAATLGLHNSFCAYDVQTRGVGAYLMPRTWTRQGTPV